MKTQKIPCNVIVCSDEYGGEEFGEYDTLPKAYRAISRLALSAAKLNDGILREYHVNLASNLNTVDANTATE